MKFWYTPETQLEFSRRGGNTAVQAVLDMPEYDAMQPHFPAYKYMIDKSRDFWHDPAYAEMLAVQQEAWNGYLTDVVTDARFDVQSRIVPAGNGRAVVWIVEWICPGVLVGATESISETMPATWGVAMLVPL